MQIAVSGGKGGTGKSTVAINLAIALAERYDLVLADLDVEAPNDHLLLGVELANEEPVELFMPRFDYGKCTRCRKCAEVCEEHAIITMRDGTPFLMPNLCSGCRACEIVCPVPGAILPDKKLMGHTYLTETPYGFPLVTGRLLEGEERAMPVVSRAKRRAQGLGKELLMVDTAAGTSNTVSKALEDSGLIIAITEPTPLGIHDGELILELAKLMNVPAMVVVNRSDLGEVAKVREIAGKYGAEVIAEIPYSENIIRSYVEGKPIVLTDYPEAGLFREIASRVVEFLGGGE
ncbi:nucleotide-binding protein [Thermococcus thioreducens]|uniref:Cobalamin biosynthesis protein CobQ n=1 Tax=Thermococcus thioreducens TaxID=277988 RepID=A0A0Q2M2U6_9EURY|nr:ATP-binding protein [Thermococcus thioreducens]ASJ12755.1 cobalamin biosynthesis protein CobQ [Thermococcus thioreducens]KQH82226.1 cobalamin biosynthesis protein CobQ [Thermococcus thioreducens]SEV85706.1 MinD superfamily P-loop ATPase, contains an inserted ferredoxin domain [Thermococcus thioreducens]